MNRRTLSLLLIAGAVPLAAGACLPDGGSPPPPVLQEGPFSESEPNNTAAQADVLPAAASGFVVNGSQNDSDDPATGDTDVFQLAAVQDGTLTVTCTSGVNTGTTLTVRNVTTGATGASGAIYLQRLLHYLDKPEHELHVVFSAYAKQVIHEELGELKLPANATEHSDKSMNAPFASGSVARDRGTPRHITPACDPAGRAPAPPCPRSAARHPIRRSGSGR